MSKQFLQKPRYEYYKGTTEVIDNELDNFVEDVVDRLNEQYFNKRDLLKVKQNQDEQIADLQHKLEVAEIALNEMSVYAINDNDLYDLVIDFNIENERYDENHLGVYTCDVVDYFKEQAEKEVKGE